MAGGGRATRVLLPPLLALTACAAPPRPAGTAVVASGADLESPNPLLTVHPLSRQVQRHALLVTLARYDAALRPAPYYARRWAWSADRRALTLWLEPTLRWHDGAPTTARDAAFTFALAADRRVGSPRRAEVAGLHATVLDDTTLVVRFATPQADVPAVLCELPLVPRHLLDTVPPERLRQAAYERAPVGNGPYRFAGRVPGARWRFARNGGFPRAMGGPPRLTTLVVAVVDEPTTKFAGLVAGDLDVAGIAPTAAATLAADPALRVLSYPVAFSTALVFNAQRPPFDDARVRRAVSLAIDRRRVVDAALAGYGVPAAGAVPPDHPYAAAAPVPQPDAATADSLLDSAGWRRGAGGIRVRGGLPLAVELRTVGSGDNAVEQLLQADLAARGIRMSIRTQELGGFLVDARARAKRYDLLITGVPGDLALSHLVSMFAAEQAGGSLDYAGFHRPALDAALAGAAAAATPADRRAAWAGVQRVLADSAPVAWVYHARGVQGVARRLANVTMDLRGELATVHDWSPLGRPATP